MGNCLSREGAAKKGGAHESHNGAMAGQLNNQQLQNQTPNHHQQMHHGGARVSNIGNIHTSGTGSKEQQQQQHETSATAHSNNGTPNRGVGGGGGGSGERYTKNPSPGDALKDTRPLGSASSSGGQQKVVVALYSYEARADGDLSFRKVFFLKLLSISYS